MKRILLIILIVILFTSCAEVSPHTSEFTTSDPAGFFSGVWHGLVIEFSIIGSIFFNDIAVYQVDNVGWWYDAGFFVGCVLLLGGFKSSKSND